LAFSNCLQDKLTNNFYLSKNNQLLFNADKNINKIRTLKINEEFLQVSEPNIEDTKRILKINREFIKPIEFSVLNKKYKISDKIKSKTVGRDILVNFQKHFANILWKNYQIYLLLKNLKVLLQKNWSIKSLYKLFSLIKIRKMTSTIISKIKKIQLFIKLKMFKHYLIFMLHPRCKRHVHLFKKLKFLKFKKTISKINIFKNRLKQKSIQMNQNLYNKLRFFYKVSLKSVYSTQLLSSNEYYSMKIKLKFMFFLIKNLR
jgi:hypothetical protein